MFFFNGLKTYPHFYLFLGQPNTSKKTLTNYEEINEMQVDINTQEETNDKQTNEKSPYEI